MNKNKVFANYIKSPVMSIDDYNRLGISTMINGKQTADSILVLGAGPSLNKNLSAINKYLEENKNTIVIGTSYNFPIPADYVMMVGTNSYNSRHVSCKNIIIREWVYWVNSKTILKDIAKKRKRIFVIRTYDRNPLGRYGKYWKEDIVLSADGSFNHVLGDCGFTALLAASYFNPKKIAVIGMDGPEPDGRTFKYFIKTRTKTMKSMHADSAKLKRNFLFKTMQFLNNLNIEIVSWKNDSLWGIGDSKMAESLNLKRLG